MTRRAVPALNYLKEGELVDYEAVCDKFDPKKYELIMVCAEISRMGDLAEEIYPALLRRGRYPKEESSTAFNR